MKFDGEFPYKCNQGKMSKLKHFGLMPEVNDDNYKSNDYCSDYKAKPEIKQCTEAFIATDAIATSFNKECQGKS